MSNEVLSHTKGETGAETPASLLDQTSMSPKATEAEDCIDAKRAEYERFTYVVLSNGWVNIRNDSYGSEANEHIHSVEPEAGRCSCKHQQYREPEGGCKHIRAVRNAPLIRASAKAAGSTAKAVATDGGHDAETVRVAERGDELECECGARTGRPIDMSHHIDLHHPEAENPLPEITHHTEPAEVGGQRYARCEGCGSESIHGAHRILHETGCALR